MILRECKCGVTATTDEELDLFKASRDSKYGRSNQCKECALQQGNKDRQKRRHTKKVKAATYLGGECEECGIKATPNNIIIFDFHHVNPEDKEHTPSKLLVSGSWSRIKEEMDKCILLCANCHRMEHAGNTYKEMMFND